MHMHKACVAKELHGTREKSLLSLLLYVEVGG